MKTKPATMTTRRWVLRQLITFLYFQLAIDAAASWARYLMHDHPDLPWPLYLIGGALFLWAAVIRVIEDATREKDA